MIPRLGQTIPVEQKVKGKRINAVEVEEEIAEAVDVIDEGKKEIRSGKKGLFKLEGSLKLLKEEKR